MAWRDLVLQLAETSPGCKAIYDDWVEPDGYVSWHSFMSDVSRLATARFMAGEAGDKIATAEVERIMRIVEDRLTHGDDDEVDATHVSFLEMLRNEWELGYGVTQLLGPHSKEAFTSMLTWKPPE